MNSNPLPASYADHDRFENELFQTKSVTALKYLIDAGRELEFHCGDIPCFLTRSNPDRLVSLWCHDTEQCFASMEELLAHSCIHDIPFQEAWQTAELDFLF